MANPAAAMYAAQFGAGADPAAAAAALAAQQHAYAQQHAAAAALQQHLRTFWAGQAAEMEATTDFKNHNLPLARIKKIMKSDEDVRMISSEAPALFAKACEMFILELTLRSWTHSEENKRRTLQRSDISTAIGKTDIFDFLVDVVPQARDDALKAEGDGGADGGAGAAAAYGAMPAGLYMLPPGMMAPPGAGGAGR